MISYKPFKKLLIDYDIKINELVDAKILTPTNSVYMNNDSGYLNLKTIDRVCGYLSNRVDRSIAISDILLYIPGVEAVDD